LGNWTNKSSKSSPRQVSTSFIIFVCNSENKANNNYQNIKLYLILSVCDTIFLLSDIKLCNMDNIIIIDGTIL